MATKEELRTAFRAQGDSMGNCCSGASDPLASECFGLRGRRTQIATRVAAWNALADESAAYDPVIADLEASADRLANAGDDAECRAAVSAGHDPLDALERLLDETGT